MEQKQLTNWQVVGIGVMAGALISLATLFFVGPIPLLFSIPGAFIGKLWKKTRLAIWIGAILGAILASVVVILIFLYIMSHR